MIDTILLFIRKLIPFSLKMNVLLDAQVNSQESFELELLVIIYFKIYDNINKCNMECCSLIPISYDKSN